jgi:hypothetical protein
VAVVDTSHNVTNVERAVVVPVKPVPKPVHEPVEPIAPGGAKNPNVPGGDKAPSDPAPLVPVDKTPTAPVTDKDGNAAPTSEDKDLDLWCPAENIVAKRSLEARTGGRGCSSRRTDREGDELREFYSTRSRRGEGYISSRPHSTVDYAPRIRDNYRMEREESPEPFIGDYLDRTGYRRDYGFEHDYSADDGGRDWATYSTHANDNPRQPVARVSYGRSRRNPDHIAVLAHERFAERDSNFYTLDAQGRPRTNDDGDYILRDDRDSRSAPVSEIVGRGARVSYHSPISPFLDNTNRSNRKADSSALPPGVFPSCPRTSKAQRVVASSTIATSA